MPIPVRMRRNGNVARSGSVLCNAAFAGGAMARAAAACRIPFPSFSVRPASAVVSAFLNNACLTASTHIQRSGYFAGSNSVVPCF